MFHVSSKSKPDVPCYSFQSRVDVWRRYEIVLYVVGEGSLKKRSNHTFDIVGSKPSATVSKLEKVRLRETDTTIVGIGIGKGFNGYR
ncbi:hypothetical protein LXL04_001672 [Taraxacum kok-saghyz]